MTLTDEVFLAIGVAARKGTQSYPEKNTATVSPTTTAGFSSFLKSISARKGPRWALLEGTHFRKPNETARLATDTVRALDNLEGRG
jgi:hypothetical protein